MKRIRLLCLLVIAVTVWLSPRATAQGGYLYSLNPSGNLGVNGNKINSLPGDFDTDFPSLNLDDAWRDLAVDGGNVYAIRGNGLVVRNGAKIWGLPFETTSAWFWTKIEFTNGTVYALRQNGNLAVNDAVVANLPRGDFFYTALQVIDGVTYALRSDGNIYRNTATTPLFSFRAGTGLGGLVDGREDDTLWVALRASPAGDYLYALRSDGVLYRAAVPTGDESGEFVERLPFPGNLGDYNSGELYADFEFDDVTGEWVVLRVNGKVYREPDALQPRDDFPGSGTSADTVYLDVAVFNGRIFAMRGDGEVYVEDRDDALLRLGGRYYGRMQISADPPVLSGQKNNAPSVVQYTVTANTGGLPLKIPVVATDVETVNTNLLITPVELPPGAIWDGGLRQMTWTTPAEAGSANFSYLVDDGNGSAKTYTSKLKFKLPDAVPEKNKAPYLPKLKNAVALIGSEYRLFLPVGDPDDDPVTVSVNPLSYPLNAGAQYLPGPSEFVWTPQTSDLGKHTIEFVYSDGTTTATLKLKLEVKSPLFIAPLPE